MSQRSFLACRLADESVAVPLERVIGVVEGTVVTPLPYSAPAFEGLVEAFGQVMPQVSLAALLSRASTPGGILVVVSDLEGSLALRVLHVTGMIQADEEAIPPTIARARARSPLYAGVLEPAGEPIYVLDLDLLSASEELELSAVDGAVLFSEVSTRPPIDAPDDEWLPVLLLEIAGDRYAIPNDAIVEIVVPGEIRPMPGAPEWVLGLIDVRGTPIAAVSTAALLGRPAGSPDICLIAELEEGVPMALFVDRAVGLERVPPADIHAMPQTMAGVRGYFVLGDGRIVGMLDPKQLVAQVEATLHEITPRRGEQTVALDGGPMGRNQQLLTLRVGPELYGMTLDRIERIQASVELTPLPETVEYFDGMADVGDAIVPVIDLRRQQGPALGAFDTTQKPPCILTMLEGALTGILVDQVLSILDIPPDHFEPVKEASRLPISHIVTFEERLISVLTIDRLLPTA